MRPHELYKRSRSCEVTCLSFGANRKEEFPDHFFCHACDLLEDAVLSAKRRCNRNQTKYRCKGGHTNLAQPTTLKKNYRASNAPRSEMIGLVTSDSPRSNFVAGVGEDKTMTAEDSSTSSTESVRRKDDNSGDWRELLLSNVTHTTDLITPAHEQAASFLCDPRRLFSTDDVSQATSAYTPATVGTRMYAEEVTGVPLTCVTASSISSANSRRYAELEVHTSLLQRRCMELHDKNVTLQMTVQTLSTQIAQLQQMQQCQEGQEEEQIISIRSEADDTFTHQEVGDDEEASAAAGKRIKQRHRVSNENSKLSQKFSILISDFMTTTDVADRRKFPECRLAKIIVDSVTGFEWTHSEVLRFAKRRQRQTTTGRHDKTPCTNTADNNGHLCSSAQFTSELLALLNSKRQGRHRGDKSKAAQLVDCMWDDTFLHGEAKAYMIERVRQYLRQHVFSPSKVLKAMDTAGFKLSLEGIEVLRSVEVSSKYGRGSLPSKSTILRAARKLEAAALDICPFTMIGQTFQRDSQNELNETEDDDDPIGEGFEFDAVKVTETLFKAFGLIDEAKRRSVELGLTSDGAQLTNSLSHVAAGLKFNDVAMRDPVTKQPMLLHSPDSLVQSRNLCFPLRIVIAKDSKKTLEGFRSLYKSFSDGDVAEALKCRPFRMSFPGDMKLQWGALNEGGAAKVKEQFCYICPCRSSTIHIPQDKTKCPVCISRREGVDVEAQDNEDHECYHYPFFADPGVRATLNEELDVLTSLLNRRDEENIFDEDNREQRMYVRRPGEVMVDGDLLDIDFQPSTARNKAAWSARITAELSDRSMSISGILRERQQRLREVLLNEQRARDLTHMLEERQPQERAMYLVLQAVVCILHLENRVGLKSIESILRSGFSNAQKGILAWTRASRGGAQHRQDVFVQRIAKIIGSEILGTADAPAQWRFPLLPDGSMGALSMDNNRTRSIMNSIELLVAVSFPDEDINKTRLLRCFPKYRAAMVLLRKNTDLSEEEISTFQYLIDGWFNDWVKVYGKEGCTNYTHMLSSSHVMKYMQEWKCLHRFSQQGWEALNALIKSYFFRRTNRGGLSRYGTKKSKLIGIARWLQRRIMWYSGQGDALFVDADVNECYDNDSVNADARNGNSDYNSFTSCDEDDSTKFDTEEDNSLASEDDDDLSLFGTSS